MSALHLIALLLAPGCAARKPSPVPPDVQPLAPPETTLDKRPQAPESADYAQLDLLRSAPGGAKIYVQATLPDGELGLFLVDTGAAVSAISADLAARLDLEPKDRGRSVTGLSGRARWLEAELPWVDLGGVVVEDIEVAVDVPGLPAYAGRMPLDGILGNNVWGKWVLSIDYPADVLEIGSPERMPVPESAATMSFDDMHLLTRLVLEVAGPEGERVAHDLVLELDTGSHGLLLSGPGPGPLAPYATEAEEPILGLGASDAVPVSAFYRRTRRIPLESVTLGGARVSPVDPASWVNYDEADRSELAGSVGLAGHELFEGHRAIFDYPGERFALVPSEREPRQLNGHAVLLEQEIAAHGEPPERGLIRAQLRIAQRDLEGARVDLEALLAAEPDNAEARTLWARLLRSEGDLQGYLSALEATPAGDLADQGEAVAVVNSLVLSGRLSEALSLAQACVAERPGDTEALLALSDALLASGDFDGARRALFQAAKAAGNPDAFLKRRARVALAEGDTAAALSHVRQRLALYPADGEAIWFYATLVAAPELGGLGMQETAPTFRADLDRAMARLHPEAWPLDYLIAAQRLLGAPPERLSEMVDEGILRDCADVAEPPSLDNCRAWFKAMGGLADDEVLALIREAVAADPHRANFMDTLAMVHLARAELSEASAAAIEAARLAPDAFYYLWQAERISKLASESPSD
ncbi:MAG: tetratricopeptide repeat protein [Alphaproteobacteria bacterium]|nr:tetratricopeptide repeat protein [Alphaproteobacteria bacterium]